LAQLTLQTIETVSCYDNSLCLGLPAGIDKHKNLKPIKMKKSGRRAFTIFIDMA